MYYISKVNRDRTYAVIDTQDGVTDVLTAEELKNYLLSGLIIAGASYDSRGLLAQPYSPNRTDIYEYLEFDLAINTTSMLLAQRGIRSKICFSTPCLSIIRGEIMAIAMSFFLGESPACDVRVDFSKKIIYIRLLVQEDGHKLGNQTRADLARALAKNMKKHSVTVGFRTSLVK